MQQQLESITKELALADGSTLTYTLRGSDRSRRLVLSIKSGGKVIVTVPRGMSLDRAEQFVVQKKAWLQRQLQRQAGRQSLGAGLSAQELHEAKQRAYDFITARLDAFRAHYPFAYRKVAVRIQRTRWGSCSSRGVLSFNAKLIFLPAPLVDYVVVHELCHVKEMNHSARFWRLVAETIPDYKERRRALNLYQL